MAEILAIRWCLNLAKYKNIDTNLLQSDCLHAVHCINHISNNVVLESIAEACRILCKSFNCASVVFIPRTQNVIAHNLARCGYREVKLLRKDQGVVWTEDCQKAFDSIKEYLLEPPILIPPVEGRPLIMYLTVLEESMGCMLGQQDETGKKEHAIYYLSKKFTDCESRYSMLEKTCCALAWASKRLRQYMINNTTWLISKMDPIKYVFEKPALTGRIARWQMLLSEYDIEYRAQKAVKGSILADHLAHQPINEYQSLKFDFPDEDVLYLKMKDCDEPLPEEGPEPGSRWGLIFDGAVNAFGNGIGAIIITPKGTHIPFSARLLFECTNNIAEYEACIMGLEEAIDLRIKILDIYGDSALVINQIKDKWETYHPGLIPYRDYARRLLTFFNKVELHHIPRDQNRMADALATLSSMFKVNHWNDMPTVRITRLERPAYVFATEAVIDDKPWFHDIKRFLQTQEYPLGASNKDKKTLRRLSGSFFLNGDVLYKRNFDMVLLRCVDRHEADMLMHEVHEGSFGTHSNGHANMFIHFDANFGLLLQQVGGAEVVEQKRGKTWLQRFDFFFFFLLLSLLVV
ncbi:uncharacterized protein LOC131597582 [Vicia villosa]|uniref:uncharacterized protein LOC131597582 n=2 Tax=Vicia villosa TaxID=3911 RepID=UPI00273B3710|nr:uncharacterized protein LOC131597582 [Vicia villosa]